MKEKLKKEKSILTPEQEQMRLNVVDLELKARFWKAQFEIRHFTLEAEKLQTEYNKFLEESQKAMQAAAEEYQALIKKQQELEKEKVVEEKI